GYLGSQDIFQIFEIDSIRPLIVQYFTIVCDSPADNGCVGYFSKFQTKYNVDTKTWDQLNHTAQSSINTNKIFLLDTAHPESYLSPQTCNTLEYIFTHSIAQHIVIGEVISPQLTPLFQSRTLSEWLLRFRAANFIFNDRTSQKWITLDSGADLKRITLSQSVEIVSVHGDCAESDSCNTFNQGVWIRKLQLDGVSQWTLDSFDLSNCDDVTVTGCAPGGPLKLSDEVCGTDIHSLRLNSFSYVKDLTVPKLRIGKFQMAHQSNNEPFLLNINTGEELTELSVVSESQSRVLDLRITSQTKYPVILDIRGDLSGSKTPTREAIKVHTDVTKPTIPLFGVHQLKILRCEYTPSLLPFLENTTIFYNLHYLSISIHNNTQKQALRHSFFPQLSSLLFFNENPDDDLAYPQIIAPRLEDFHILKLQNDGSLLGLSSYFPLLKSLMIRPASDRFHISNCDPVVNNLKYLEIVTFKNLQACINNLNLTYFGTLQTLVLRTRHNNSTPEKFKLMFQAPKLQSIDFEIEGAETNGITGNQIDIVGFYFLQKVKLLTTLSSLNIVHCPNMECINLPFVDECDRLSISSDVSLSKLRLIHVGGVEADVLNKIVTTSAGLLGDNMTASNIIQISQSHTPDSPHVKNTIFSNRYLRKGQASDHEWRLTLGDRIYGYQTILNTGNWTQHVDSYKEYLVNRDLCDDEDEEEGGDYEDYQMVDRNTDDMVNLQSRSNPLRGGGDTDTLREFLMIRDEMGLESDIMRLGLIKHFKVQRNQKKKEEVKKVSNQTSMEGLSRSPVY
ncbi:hypothetical protein WICPIJ_001353, partial [Wickerhamomyces pijperi]